MNEYKVFVYPYEELERKLKIAYRFHQIREYNDYTLQELANIMGVTKPTVLRWELGWRKMKQYIESGEAPYKYFENPDNKPTNTYPSIEQLFKLAKIYHCDANYLLCEPTSNCSTNNYNCVDYDLALKMVNRFKKMIDKNYELLIAEKY